MTRQVALQVKLKKYSVSYYSLGLRAFCALEWLAQKELYSLKWFT